MCSLDCAHPVWNNIENPLDVMKATVKAKLLIQRYPLASSPTAGQHRSDTCMLCKTEAETTSHFLLHCPALKKERNTYLPRILNTCRDQLIPVDVEMVTRVILDSTYLNKPDSSHEITCRNLVYKLHSKRSVLLGRDSRYKSSQ